MELRSTHPPPTDPARSPLPYLASLALPVTTSALLVADANRNLIAAMWLVILVGFAVADEVLPPLTRRRAPDGVNGVAFGRLADLVALVQLANFGLFAWRSASWGLSMDALFGVVLVGVGSAFSSMIAAHELIHRPRGPSRWLGRALLWTALYDQFFTEHLRGHHRTVGTADDVLTARTDETFGAYLLRSWPGELRSAWKIEAKRAAGRGPLGRLTANEVVRGLSAEAVMLLVIGTAFGPVAVALVVTQATVAHLLVVATNFVEHWGIVRSERKVSGADAWDSAAPLSHFALLGLSFHADHHVRASRPFDRLELHPSSPQLPHGYFTMVALVLFRSEEVRQRLRAELERHRSLPDVADASVDASQFNIRENRAGHGNGQPTVSTLLPVRRYQTSLRVASRRVGEETQQQVIVEDLA